MYEHGFRFCSTNFRNPISKYHILNFNKNVNWLSPARDLQTLEMVPAMKGKRRKQKTPHGSLRPKTSSTGCHFDISENK